MSRRDSGTAATLTLPDGVRCVREERSRGAVPLHVHPEWAQAFPWLVQGTTGRGEGAPFDLGLFGTAPVGPVLRRWGALREAAGMPAAVHAHQVHGAGILAHDRPLGPGLLITEGVDGHRTGAAGILLTVSVADCVPVFLVAPRTRRVAMLHGGWRGTAAGIVPAGIRDLGGDSPGDLHVHLGPAICGGCYEVGPEVHEALGLPVPPTNTPADIRAVQARQAIQAGVPAGQVTASAHCTRCGDGFFSHRAGDPERQMGVVGIRA